MNMIKVINSKLYRRLFNYICIHDLHLLFFTFCIFFQAECNNILCSRLHYLHQGTCTETFSSINNAHYILFLRFIPLYELRFAKVFQIIEDIIAAIIVKSSFFKFSQNNFACSTQASFYLNSTQTYIENLNELNVISIDTYTKLYWTDRYESHNVVVDSILKAFHNKTFTVRIDNESYDFNVYVVSSAMFFPSMLELLRKSVRNMPTICNLDSDSQMKLSYEHRFERDNYTTIVPKVMVYCKRSTVCNSTPSKSYNAQVFYLLSVTACPKIEIKYLNYSWQETLEGKLISPDGFVVDSVDFEKLDINTGLNDTIHLCLNVYQDYNVYVSKKYQVIMGKNAASLKNIACLWRLLVITCMYTLLL